MAFCGCFQTPEEREMRLRNKNIEKQLENDARDYYSEVKMLLLGPGESGKSTIFRQMKIMQKEGYSEDEREDYKNFIYYNIVSQMKVLIQAAEKLEIPLEQKDNIERAERVKSLSSFGEAFTPAVGEDCKALWGDRGIQEVYCLRDREYQLNDNVDYFMESVDRVKIPNYVPTDQDIVRARVRTTGINEADFEFQDLKFKLVDVGGQRNERRKWIHCFEDVTAIIFVVSLAEYDQRLREDETQNRMKESLLLFSEICNSVWFKDTAIVLFLNKTDLFKKKLEKVDLRTCFPDYAGGPSFEVASQYIVERFVELNKYPGRQVYPYLTCGINTENVKFVFNAVKDHILKLIISGYMLGSG